MRVHATRASQADVDVLETLYRGLETEMSQLHRMWPLADGLDEPVADSLRAAIDDERTVVLVGWIDDVPFGFLIARVEDMLSQAEGENIGAIRLIYVDPHAREVAVGEVMRDQVMDILRERGISKFDAHVLPGHRLAKNFFEAGGFAARSIIMHHDDDR
ncbi:MAG: GNAT family N-acetyltransferase [Actinobacteria bacterium]|nr:GNAT family N-acetyltransferase [Actinomycetota bacterium]MCI0677942.1 GNAT family N-acetyltransferase [Actinomycetota bacterium]